MPNRAIRMYVWVWIALLVLLALNLGIVGSGLGHIGASLHLGIGALQAMLIIVLLMNVKISGAPVRIAAVAGFLWLFLFGSGILGDIQTRLQDTAIGRLSDSPPAWVSALGQSVIEPHRQVLETTEAGPSMAHAEHDPAWIEGKRVYEGTCIACHASGVLGAPRMGDKAAWQARLAKGLEMLTSHAAEGFGGMPPKGGNSALTRQQIRQVVHYMLISSGIPAVPSSDW